MKQICLAFGLMIAVCNPVYAIDTDYKKIVLLASEDTWNYFQLDNYLNECGGKDRIWFLVSKRESQHFAVIYSAFKKDRLIKLSYKCHNNVAYVDKVRIK